jgi:CRP-like cAMP-binding protein
MSAEVDPAALRRFPCFRELSEEQARAAVPSLQTVHLGAGDVLFRQGDPGEDAYLLVSGRIEIRLKVAGQEDRVLATLQSGAILGEIGLLVDEPRSATVVAGADSQLWRVPRDTFESALDRGEAWAIRFLLSTSHTLAHRLVSLNQQVVSLLSKTTGAHPQFAGAPELEQLLNRLASQWQAR